MESISFRCTKCNQGLKVAADKAGRKIKCGKCGTELTIPESNADASKPAPPPAPEPPKPADDEDDKKGYGFQVVPEAPAEEKKKDDKPKKDDKKKPAPLKRKFRSLPDPELWEKVKTGLQIIMVGTHIWGGAVLFLAIMVFLGILNGPEYATIVENAMTVKTDTPAGEVVTPHMPTLMFGLVTGSSYQGIGKIFYTLAAVLSLFQIIVMSAGYAVCLNIPDRFGTKGQIGALLGFAALNFLLVLVFRLLPSIGVIKYILVPYALPEVALIDANMDRDQGVWVVWSGSPFWETCLAVLCILAFYAEPVLIGVFIWSIGATLREEPVSEKGQGVVAMSFGIAFALIAYLLLSMAGTSGVALIVVRGLYLGWLFFTVLLLIRLPMAIQPAREIIQKYVEGAAMREEDEESKGKDDEDEDEDEDEEDDRPKGKRKRARDEDEDDDD
jgi:phage FluMu protein Com